MYTEIIYEVHEDHLVFRSGNKLSSYHPTECCELHSLNFWESHNDLIGKTLNIDREGNFFERVEDSGIRLKIENDHPVFVPGYGDNNGCYTDELKLIYKNLLSKVTWKWDITECQDIAYDE